VHEILATLMLVVVSLHVMRVIAGSWLHRENLVAAMISGRKHGTPPEGIKRGWRGLGLLLLAAVLGFWFWQLQHPTEGMAHAESAMPVQADGREDDD
jgi:hypothetical protein